MPDRFDVVVAGAGHNSLIAAAYLAKAGFRCLVLEGRPVVGGNCVTEELTLRSARYYLPLPDRRNSDASLEERLSDAGRPVPMKRLVVASVELYTTAEEAAGSVGMELSAIDLRDAGEIERAIADFAQRPNGGLIMTASQFGTNHPGPLAALAARHKLPAVYWERFFVTTGGLISYGPNYLDQYRRAAGYVDRILKGEKPADLPVQAPTKYELVINLKTARALGLEIPPTLLARADEVIE